MAKETAHYLHGHHESVLRSHSWRTAENSAAYLLPEIEPDMTILDIGCGPGTITADLAALVPNGRVVGVDHAESILAQARVLAAERDLTNVEFAAADIHALYYDDDSFDVVHAHQVLQHVGNPVQALREMRRVCRPGGVVAARDWAATSWYPDSTGLDDWLELFNRVARASGGTPEAGRYLKAWALEVGFTEAAIRASSSTWTYSTPAEREWWSGLWADRIVHSEFAKLAVESGNATVAELDAAATAWRAWGAREDGWFAILNGEILCRA
jgi:ubiquinone/menaquinone biosynthesis C-methylase UbiE